MTEGILIVVAVALIAGGGTILLDYLVVRKIRRLGPPKSSPGESAAPSKLTEEEAMRLAVEETHAVRAERRAGRGS